MAHVSWRNPFTALSCHSNHFTGHLGWGLCRKRQDIAPYWVYREGGIVHVESQRKNGGWELHSDRDTWCALPRWKIARDVLNPEIRGA